MVEMYIGDKESIAYPGGRRKNALRPQRRRNRPGELFRIAAPARVNHQAFHL